MHIPLCVIIPTYKSPYGGARVAHTSGPTCSSGAVGPDRHAVGEMLKPDKITISPLLYHLCYIVGLIEGVFQHGIRVRGLEFE
jgi:hypothetical protein